MNFPTDPSHPFYWWSTAIVILVCLTVILAVNANDFDATELKAIGWSAVTIVAALGGKEKLAKLLAAKSAASRCDVPEGSETILKPVIRRPDGTESILNEGDET